MFYLGFSIDVDCSFSLHIILQLAQFKIELAETPASLQCAYKLGKVPELIDS